MIICDYNDSHNDTKYNDNNNVDDHNIDNDQHGRRLGS